MNIPPRVGNDLRGRFVDMQPPRWVSSLASVPKRAPNRTDEDVRDPDNNACDMVRAMQPHAMPKSVVTSISGGALSVILVCTASYNLDRIGVSRSSIQDADATKNRLVIFCSDTSINKVADRRHASPSMVHDDAYGAHTLPSGRQFIFPSA
jgi:hypothetical protein